jgi:hypothetical protein
MLDARGNLEPVVDVLLHQRLKNWGFKGCSERTLADEPSYWLRRLLAPVEFKWHSGLHMEVPAVHVSQNQGGALQSAATGPQLHLACPFFQVLQARRSWRQI